MKVKTNGSKLPNAWVTSVIDRGRRKIYNGNKIYLKNGEEFEIELYNPTPKNVLALISLDGKPISKSGLVVKSGERFYLDCFLDDLKKFTFETYNVEDSEEVQNSIAKNGELEVFFYNEEISDRLDLSKLPGSTTEIHHHHYNNGYRWYPSYYDPFWYGTTISNGIVGTTNTTFGIDVNFDTLIDSINIGDIKSTDIETGQVAKGENSNQKFKDIEMNFEDNYISNVSYKLLPESRIPKNSSDVTKASMNKISNKLADSEFIVDLIYRLVKFSDLKSRNFIEKEEFSLIKEKTIKSIIDKSLTIEIEHIDDLASYISSLGDLMQQNLISKEEFKTIKTNLFNSIK